MNNIILLEYEYLNKSIVMIMIICLEFSNYNHWSIFFLRALLRILIE